MNYQKSIFTISIVAALAGLTACGVSTQDEGSASVTPVSGIAVDGYLKGAKVFVDTNNNNKIDVWEPRAKTDVRGYFSYSPEFVNKDGQTVEAKNYCDMTPVTNEAIEAGDYVVKSGEDLSALKNPLDYCLNVPGGVDEVVLKVINGKDISTKLSFTGTLSASINLSEHDIASPSVVSPLTSLKSVLGDQADTILASENLTDEDIAKDFMNFDDADLFADDAERRALLSLALRLHSVSDMIAGRLDRQFDQDVLADPNNTSLVAEGFFGTTPGIANNVATMVYDKMAEKLSEMTLSALLGSTTEMQSIVESTWTDLVSLVESYNETKRNNASDDTPEEDLNLYLNSSVDSTVANSIAADAVSLAATVSNAFSSALSAISDDPNTTSVDETSSESKDVDARLRAIGIVTFFMREGGYDTEAAKAISLMSDPDYMKNLRYNVSMRGTTSGGKPIGLIDKIIADPVNVSAADVTGGKSINSLLLEASQNTEDAAGFTVTNTEGLSGNALNISDGDGEEESNLSIQFADNPDNPAADSGLVTIDTTFADGFISSGDSTDGETQESTTLTGTWKQNDEGEIVMDLELGGDIVPVSIETAFDAETGETVYYFEGLNQDGVWAP